MSKFTELLAELDASAGEQENLAKSLPQDSQDDANIQAAADAEGTGESSDDEVEGEGEGEGEGEEDLTKSLTLANGEVAIDATELLKAMQDGLNEHEELLMKAIPQVLVMLKGQNTMIEQQGNLIKSLQTRVETLAGQGRGRKTQLIITEKPMAGEEPLQKSQNEGLTPQEFMLKANTAFDNKVITGTQLTTIDVCIRNGQPIDAALIAKVANT